MRPTLRHFFLATALSLAALAPLGTMAQRIHGTIAGINPRPARILLSVTRGAESRPVDSVAIDRKGRFRFPQDHYPAGFYQVAITSTDRVDLLLDPREQEVVLRFTGSPLQEHITVVRSDENQRLWEYKRASRHAQQRLREIGERRHQGEDNSVLDRLEQEVIGAKQRSLERLIIQDTTSLFSTIILQDRRMERAAEQGPRALAGAMRWSDPRFVRSAIYPRAIMGYLASIPFDSPGGLPAAVDSILAWAAPDSTCWSYARELLVQVFDRFGPDEVAQYVVERYVVGPAALLPADERLRTLAGERLATAPGSRIPALRVADPLNADTVDINALITGQRYTLLFFYGSTCSHCHDEMPGVRSARDTFLAKGFEVVGIALDDDLEEFQRTLTEQAITWPCYSDLAGWGSPIAKALRIHATPSFVLIDRAGVIVAKPHDHRELADVLQRLLP